MRTKYRIFGLLLAGGALVFSTLVSAEVEYLRRAEVPAIELPLLREGILRRARDPWVHGRTDHFFYHADSGGLIRISAEEAEFANRFMHHLLGTTNVSVAAHIILFQRDKLWEQVLRETKLRPDGRAFHMDDRIYLYRPATDDPVIDVFHEIVHLHLARGYGDRLPLWLEEGLAIHLSWEIAGAFFKEKGRLVTRERPPIPRGSHFSINQLTEMTDYPEHPRRTRVFYYQCGEFVDAMLWRLGDADLSYLLRLIARGDTPWKQVLTSIFSWDKQDFLFAQDRMTERLELGWPPR